MKKSLLGLGILSIAILPMVAVASCSSNSSKTPTDLGITAKHVKKSVITDAIRAISKYPSPTESELITALSTVFSGVSTETFNKFTRQTTIDQITLTANPGFSFGMTANGSAIQQLVSTPNDAEVEVVDLSIRAIPSTQGQITDIASKINETESSEVFDLILQLGALFIGVNIETLKGFEIIANTEIILTAKPGYTINGQKTLTSIMSPDANTNYTIEPIPSSQAQIDEAWAYSQSHSTFAGNFKSLVPIFNGLTHNIIYDLSITKSNNLISLTTQSGNTINGEENLFSIMSPDADTNYTITSVPSSQAQIDEAWTSFSTMQTPEEQVKALAPIFDGLTVVNIQKFNIDIEDNQIRLTAKQGISINHKKIVVSIVWNLPVINLLIEPIPYTYINQVAMNIFVNPNAIELQVSQLSQVFEGVTIENILNMEIDLVQSDAITLICKPGFTINGNRTLTTVKV